VGDEEMAEEIVGMVGGFSGESSELLTRFVYELIL